MVSWKALGMAVLASTISEAATKCDANNHCPKDKPCCDEYGQCGTGMACLGGCDPQSSYDLKSCMPMPACKSGKTSFDSIKDIGKIQTFNGDSEKYPWVYTGKILEYDSDDSVLITMPKDSVGTVLSSTNYIWYGNIKATMKTSRGDGVVTDFILMSNVKDEVDYEFVGNDLQHAQTNYYFQGVLDWGKQVKGEIDNSYSKYHTYEVDWTEDEINWKIDDKTVRTLKKSETWNDTTKAYEFPQTPARLQLGIWPGGGKNQGEGTIEWAGGKIDWDSEDIKKNGYYSASVKNVEITCYDPPSDTKKSGSKSYVYKDRKGLASDIEITDDDHILYDMKNSGNDNKSKSIPDASEVSTSSKSIPDASEEKTKTTKKSDKAKETKSSAGKTTDSSATATATTGGNNKSKATSTSSESDDGDFGVGGADKTTSSTMSSNNAGGYVVPSLMAVMGFAYALL